MTRNGSTTDYDSRAEYATYAYAYDLLYGDHNDDFGFYLNCAKQYVEDGGSILELGMGTGRLSAYLAQAGYRIVGIDNSKEMIKLALQDNLWVVASLRGHGCLWTCG